MTWTISPGIGLLPAKFGMSRVEIAQINGLSANPRYRIETGFVPEDAEYGVESREPHEPSFNYRDGICDRLSAGWRVPNVIFQGFSIFDVSSRAFLAALEEANGKPGVLVLGFLEYRNINISIEGFYLDRDDRFFDKAEMRDQDDRIVIMHAPGPIERFEGAAERPISFL